MEPRRKQQAPRSASFIIEAVRELRRKRERKELQKLAEQYELERSSALARLGERAWDAQIDLTAFSEYRDQLAGLQQRNREVTVRIEQLEIARATLEARKTEETASFETQRQLLEHKKTPAEVALKAAQQKQEQQERALRKSTARQQKVAADMTSIEQQIIALVENPPADQQEKTNAAQARKDQLISEHNALVTELKELQGALPAAKAEVQRLTKECGHYEEQVELLEAAHRAALEPIDEGLQNITASLVELHHQTKALAATREEQYQKLGWALFSSQSSEQALATELQQISVAQGASLRTLQSIEASEALSQKLRPGTLRKFWTLVLSLPVILLALAVAGYFVGLRAQQRQLAVEFQALPEPPNPYLSHELSKHPAYQLADFLSEAKNEEQVQDLLLEAFRNLNLGIYTSEGKQIQAGAEVNGNDFFLYDFQWKTLARAYHVHNLTNYSGHSALLAKAVVGEDPLTFEPELTTKIQNRYQEALRNPLDRKSYLTLLIDGLARHQPKPYSLSELGQRSPQELQVDALQSFLIMLEFLLGSQQKQSASWHWQLIPAVYAKSACEITGNKGEKRWGVDTMFPGISSAKRKQIAASAADLILLYGTTVTITPRDYAFHLRHQQPEGHKFTAKVVFDPVAVPEAPVKCGWLAGKQMPQPGQALSDIELTWNIEPDWPSYPIPRKLLQDLMGNAESQTRTHADGESVFLVNAPRCPHKDGNKVIGRNLMLTATAHLTSKKPLANFDPAEIEYLLNGRAGYSRFRIEWHDGSRRQ